jgi:hypothetical protein
MEERTKDDRPAWLVDRQNPEEIVNEKGLLAHLVYRAYKWGCTNEAIE